MKRQFSCFHVLMTFFKMDTLPCNNAADVCGTGLSKATDCDVQLLQSAHKCVHDASNRGSAVHVVNVQSKSLPAHVPEQQQRLK